MNSLEQLAFSILQERRGVHVLLWQDQGELARALLVFFAALPEMPCQSFLLGNTADAELLRGEIVKRVVSETSTSPDQSTLWTIFLQQGSAKAIGPWINGWRTPLSDPPGSLLIVRHADFLAFQRSAPDLASYIGARVYNAEQMLSIVSPGLLSRLRSPLPVAITEILGSLPGASYDPEELRRWSEQIAVAV